MTKTLHTSNLFKSLRKSVSLVFVLLLHLSLTCFFVGRFLFPNLIDGYIEETCKAS